MRALREVVYDDTGLERERRSLQMALDIASRPAFCYPDSTMRREWVTLRNSLHLALCPSGSMSGRSHDDGSDRPTTDTYLQEEGLPVWSDCCYEDVTPSGVEINVSGAEVDNRHAQRDAPRVDTDRQPIYSSVVRKEFACTMDNSCVLMQRDESICQANRCSQQTEEGGTHVPMHRSLSSGAIQHTERHGEPFLQHNIRVDPICLPVRAEGVGTEPERECSLVEPGGHLWYKQTETREWQNTYSEETQHPREEIDCASTCNECRTKKRDFSVVPTMCPHERQHADTCLPRKDIELKGNQTEGRCQPAEDYSHRDPFNRENMTNKSPCTENEFRRNEKARPHPESAFGHAFSECKRSWSDGENSHDYQTNGPADQPLRSDGLWTENMSGQIKQDTEQAEHYHLQSNGAGHRMTDHLEGNVSPPTVIRQNPLLSEDSESDPWKYDLQPYVPFHLRPHKNCSSTTGSTISVDVHLEEESHSRFAGYMDTTNCYPIECNSTARMDAGHVRYPNRSTLTHDDRLQTELPCQSNDIIHSFAHTDMRQPESGFTHVTEESARKGASNNVRAKVDLKKSNTGWRPTDAVHSTAEIDVLNSNMENTAIGPHYGHGSRKCSQQEDVNFVVKNTHNSLARQPNPEEKLWRMSAKYVCEDEDETHPDIGQSSIIKSPGTSHRRDLRRLTSTDENQKPMLPISTTDEVYRSLAEQDLSIADIDYAREDMDIGRGESSQNSVSVVTSPIACPGAYKRSETEIQHDMTARQIKNAEYPPQPELHCHATNIDCSRAHTHWSWLNAKYVRENIEYLYEEANREQIKLDSSLIDPVETRGEDVEQSWTGTEHGQSTSQCPRTYVGNLVSERGGPSTQEMSASRHNETTREDMGKGMFAENGQRESRLPHTQRLISERGVIRASPLPRSGNTKADHTSDQLNSQVDGIVNDCDCRRIGCLICNQTQKVRDYVNEEDIIECLVAPDYACSPRLPAPPLPHRSQFPNSEATSRPHAYEPSRLEPEHTVTSDDPWVPSSIVPLCKHNGSTGISGVECIDRGVLRTSTDTCDNTQLGDSSCVRDDGAARVVTALAGVSGVAVKRQQVESNKPLKEKPSKRSRRPAKKRRYPDVFHSYAKTALCSESALRADDAVVDKNASSSSLHGHQTAGTSSVAPPNARVPHGYARQFKLRIRLFSGRRLRRLEARRRREEKYHNLIVHSPDSN